MRTTHFLSRVGHELPILARWSGMAAGGMLICSCTGGTAAMPLWLHLPETVVGLFLAAICIGWWHIAQERSRRKRAAHDARVTAADLEENRTRLDLALRAAGMGIWYWDIVENRRHFDPQVCELLGIDAEAFTGSAEEFFRVVHPDDREMLMSALARTVEDDVMYEPVYRVINRDERVVRQIGRAHV